MRTTRPRRLYTPEFKAQAVELVAAGRPVADLAVELGVSTNLRELRREIALLRQENYILKKAAVILGTNPRTNSAR